ncbi:mRNA (guanine-N7)-methyltransferase [Saccharomycopsis crataegensis]|uniref:mRNA cap guanine-N(7) methyltransferase n=1 Tax=Saccharomycopsis crataegensis TaxID=43959 RepID=A0AAV5QMA8_9ASCO|nr:mRNA (guanine-N7)-methyltransferase [Saccharomycopsis crataegensis]
MSENNRTDIIKPLDPISGSAQDQSPKAPAAASLQRGSISSILNYDDSTPAVIKPQVEEETHQDVNNDEDPYADPNPSVGEYEEAQETGKAEEKDKDTHVNSSEKPNPQEQAKETEAFDYEINPRRPRKRKIINSKPNAFSLRRTNEEEDEKEQKKAKVVSVSLHGEHTEQEYVRKNTDQDELDYSDLQGQPSQNLDRKLKRPKGRQNVHDQMKRAQLQREREEEAEQRNLKVERQQLMSQEQGNVNDIVRSHYNQRTHFARKERRQDSATFKLRNFNNILKYMLIGKFSKPGNKVLDLACGKGGDLFKWQQAQSSLYIGLDISPASIEEAVRRSNNIRDRSFSVYFAACDAFGGDIREALSVFPPGTIELPVDVVSIQFALHYAFESEQKIRNTLANISRSLKVGGHFIGTIPSSDFIKFKIKHLKPGEKKWGNSLYSVEFLKDPPENGSFFSNPYGNTYIYNLQDAVDHVPEYVVPFEILRSLAEEYDLELRYKKPFFDLYREEIPEWMNKLSPKLRNGLRRSDGKYGLEGEEKQAAEFYLAFAFERVGYA